jgi:hypothetical protein
VDLSGLEAECVCRVLRGVWCGVVFCVRTLMFGEAVLVWWRICSGVIEHFGNNRYIE